MIYKMMIIRTSPDELKHHGIKGQRWGIRRYQKEDGSYTTEGLSRYKKGKIYDHEFNKFRDEEYNKRLKNSKQYKEYEREANRIADKYSLDRDDGGGGDYEHYDRKTLDRAGNRYWEMTENMSALEDKFSEEAYKTAGKRLTERYGNQAISDMHHYNNVYTAKWLAGVGAFTLSVAILANRKK